MLSLASFKENWELSISSRKAVQGTGVFTEDLSFSYTLAHKAK